MKPNILVNRKFGFTLAEVLITLGIIGVVAAITSPVLINKINDQQFKVAYKKAYRDVNVAYRNMQANDDEFIEITCPESGTCYNADFGQNFKLLANQFKATKTCFNGGETRCFECSNGQMAKHSSSAPDYYGCTGGYAFVDSSGRAWGMYSNQESLFFVDTNGFKGPNHIGKDRWMFLLPTPRNSNTNKSFILPRSNYDYTTKNRFCPSGDCKFYSWLYK